MKKIILYLAFITTTLVGCSKEDAEKTNAIVGNWKLVAQTRQYKNSDTLEDSFVLCDMESTYIFTQTSPTTGNLSQTEYSFNHAKQECSITSSRNYTWTDLGGNNYHIDEYYDIDEENKNIIFSNNNKTMLVTTFNDGPFSNYITKSTYVKQ